MSRTHRRERAEVDLVDSAEQMVASVFIRHVVMRHNHLGFRSRENHEQDHLVNDNLDHLHEDAELWL